MQFSSNEDIEAPIDEVFAMLSDFETFERSAMRRGIEVQRADDSATKAPGMAWDASFTMRGKPRKLHLVLTAIDPPNALHFESNSPGLDGVLTIDLVALSPRRTRLAIMLNLAPKTLSARLFLQSLKLAKSNLTKRFKVKVAEYAKAIEDRGTRTA